MLSMNDEPMFSIIAKHQDKHLGTIHSESEEILRNFGAAYMRDRQTVGEVHLHSPDGAALATFDMWQDRWTEVARNGG